MKKGFCTLCRVVFDPIPEDATCCPNCSTKSLPCASEDQVTISINWHELHILCTWAEFYARKIDRQGVVYSIAQEIEKQYPDKHKLTLAGELNRFRDEGIDIFGFDSDGQEFK